MRINKFFTDRGQCSRREADRLIEAGRVRINGKKAVLGDQVAETDIVMLDGAVITTKQSPIYIMYNKPFGVTCTTDQKIKGNIIDTINYPERIFPIGRLDKESTGLILLTNDGSIVNKILRAQYGHEKEYEVVTNQPFHDSFLKKMSAGVNIGDHITKPCKLTRIEENKFSIILTEGKNRQIRRMTDALGFKVKRLHRIRIMNILIGNLAPGVWKEIPEDELLELKNTLAKQDIKSIEVFNVEE